jgi:hypothetical protein
MSWQGPALSEDSAFLGKRMVFAGSMFRDAAVHDSVSLLVQSWPVVWVGGRPVDVSPRRAPGLPVLWWVGPGLSVPPVRASTQPEM